MLKKITKKIIFFVSLIFCINCCTNKKLELRNGKDIQPQQPAALNNENAEQSTELSDLKTDNPFDLAMDKEIVVIKGICAQYLLSPQSLDPHTVQFCNNIQAMPSDLLKDVFKSQAFSVAANLSQKSDEEKKDLEKVVSLNLSEDGNQKTSSDSSNPDLKKFACAFTGLFIVALSYNELTGIHKLMQVSGWKGRVGFGAFGLYVLYSTVENLQRLMDEPTIEDFKEIGSDFLVSAFVAYGASIWAYQQYKPKLEEQGIKLEAKAEKALSSLVNIHLPTNSSSLSKGSLTKIKNTVAMHVEEIKKTSVPGVKDEEKPSEASESEFKKISVEEINAGHLRLVSGAAFVAAALLAPSLTLASENSPTSLHTLAKELMSPVVSLLSLAEKAITLDLNPL